MSKIGKSNRGGFPRCTKKSEVVYIRVTPEFKEALDYLTKYRKGRRKYWSKSDSIHEALADLIRYKEPSSMRMMPDHIQEAVYNSLMMVSNY